MPNLQPGQGAYGLPFQNSWSRFFKAPCTTNRRRNLWRRQKPGSGIWRRWNQRRRQHERNSRRSSARRGSARLGFLLRFRSRRLELNRMGVAMDWNLKRRTFERSVALQIAQELTRTLGPVQPEMLAQKNDVICRVFGEALDRNQIVDESAAERILSYVPRLLADMNRQHAELNRQLDAAIRPPLS